MSAIQQDSLKDVARQIFLDTLGAIHVRETMRRKLARSGSSISAGHRQFDLSAFACIRAVAIGKAAIGMAAGLVDALEPDFTVEGVLVAPHDAIVEARREIQDLLPGFQCISAGHPIPDAGSLVAARAILDLLRGCDARTLVFFLLSGGGSALADLPLTSNITLADLQELNRILVSCGAPIQDINAVRKHLSAIKGGRLSAAAPEAMKVTLGLSDVPRGMESALASGPTLPDPTTVADACGVIERYRLRPSLPASIAALFAQPGEIPETPKKHDPAFARSHFALLLGMHDLFHHAHQAAEARGCVTFCDNTTDDWPLADATDYLLAQLGRLAAANPGRRVAVIADGEVSSPVTGDGTGGRNSALVLDCVEKIKGRNIAVLSAGTDGKDGSSPAAGAVTDGETFDRARAAGLDPCTFAQRSDSYNFFRQLGDAIETGPTGNNLRDLRILLAE